MNARSAFEFAARVIGLWQSLSGLEYLGSAANLAAGLYKSSFETPTALFIQAMIRLLPGLFLLVATSGLVNLVYGPPQVNVSDSTLPPGSINH